jgi:hypothetical protein
MLAGTMLLATAHPPLWAQTPAGASRDFENGLELSPMSPLFRIYAVVYARSVSSHTHVLLGPYYANIHYDDIGNTDAPGFIVGARRSLWRNLHLDYQLIPQWDHFYEKNEAKTYPRGFDLWNEVRVGYTWSFRLGRVPAYLNFQWPFGFALYSDDSAKPESFRRHADDHPFFYFPPMLFFGVRF